ncbi:MAG: hypothetical protein LBH22_03275 [Bacteroidales bacterium]|jgi:hypothetical protein|nr:hypothetical protein [Bacteroidales bacterium]
MKKEDIISILKEKKYLFELKENHIVIRLARRYFLKLDIENDNIVKSEDRVTRFGLLAKGKSLKAATKINMIASFIFCVLSIVFLCVFTPGFSSDFTGSLIITYTCIMLYPLLEYLYYNRRLLKIKKLLNINL